MTSLSDLTPGTRVKHLPTGSEGVVTAGRARLRDGLRGSVAWTGDETDPWRVYVRYWPCDGCPDDCLGGGTWCLPDELEAIPGGSGLPDNETSDR